MVPFARIVNDARWCRVRAENTPMVEVPSRTANVLPSGETASGGAAAKQRAAGRINAVGSAMPMRVGCARVTAGRLMVAA